MENIKKLDTLIQKATSQSLQQIPPQLFKQILQLINSRVDMPKHTMTSIAKRMIIKNKRTLINIFNLLQYLAYQCQLSFYSQISTKQFLFRISGLLMNKDINQEVKNKIMETVVCWEQLFRPYEDLLPLFFQFYAGLLRNGFDIPSDYSSKYKTSKPKPVSKSPYQSPNKTPSIPKPQKQYIQPSASQQKIFQQIRQQLILTNQIIDNANPVASIKQNGLLLQMIDHLKQCQKKINKTINQNPSQKIMELALAANDDIYITYRRFKDLQRNKKPQPFILTQLVSDFQKQQRQKKQKIIQKSIKKKQPQKKPQQKKPQQKKKQQKKIQKQFNNKIQNLPKNSINDQINLLNLNAQPQVIQKNSSHKQENLLDLNFQPQTKVYNNINNTNTNTNNNNPNIFDLLPNPNLPLSPPLYSYQQLQPQFLQQNSINLNQPQPSKQFPQIIPIIPIQPSINYQQSPNNTKFDSLILNTQYFSNTNNNVSTIPKYQINLDVDQYKTQNDIKNYNQPNPIDRLEELTYQFLKK